MKRVQKTISLGENRKRYVTLLYSENIDVLRGADPHRIKMDFLHEVLHDGLYSGILNCGPLPFESMTLIRDGANWVVKLEAEDS